MFLLKSAQSKKALIQTIQESLLPSTTQGSLSSLTRHTPKMNKISWSSSNPYNKRWEFKWKHSYYTYPRDGNEHTSVRKPQDSWDSVPLYYAWFQDVMFRWLPGLKSWYDRRERMFDTFSLYFLPGSSLFLY